MKAILILGFALITSIFSVAQPLPPSLPTNGLIGWWPFNGNANDESGNGNNGTINGATLTTDRYGVPNRAFTFDGVDNHILIPHNSIFNLESVGKMTISYWIKANTLSSNQGSIIICKQTGSGVTQDGWSSYIDSDSSLRTRVQNGGPSTLGDISSISKIQTNRDYFIVVIVDKSQNLLSTYINGILEIQITLGNGVIGDNTNPLIVGKPSWVFPNAKGFNGKIDDVGIWNRALTQQEITNYYQSSLPPVCPTLPSNLQTGLIAYWPFCGNADDVSGNGNNGTLINGAGFTEDLNGQPNSALLLNGVNQRVDLPLNLGGALINLQHLTISSWVKVADRNQYGIFSNWKASPLTDPFGVNFGINQDKRPYFTTNAGTGVSTFDTLQNNGWNHVIAVFDGVQNNALTRVKIYINGTLKSIDSSSTVYSSTAISSNLGSSATNTAIGAWISQFGWVSHFKGSLDDIAIWNRSLSVSEITQLYQTQGSSSSYGNVGVNVVAPQRTLHVRDIIRLEPRNSPPENPVIGDIYIDAVLKKLRVFDGTQWQNCW